MKPLKLAVLALTLVTLQACTRPQQALNVLHGLGFSAIKIEGYSPYSCAEEDFFRTRFTATNPDGAEVSGVVCSGFFKGATVRFF